MYARTCILHAHYAVPPPPSQLLFETLLCLNKNIAKIGEYASKWTQDWLVKYTPFLSVVSSNNFTGFPVRELS